MKHCALLSLLLVAAGCVCVHGAPVEQGGVEPGSCQDASALAVAGLALTKINQDRHEGYILSLHRLSNVQEAMHGEIGVVFYLTMDVVETQCHVFSRKDWKNCEARPTHDTPVYGQCKVVIYISKVHRVVRLYKYNCVIRPVPAAKVGRVCPDCPSLVAMDNAEILKTVSLSLEKFNKENGSANHFALLNVTRATSQMGMAVFYHAEFTIQETTCANSADSTKADNCPPMDCEFAHKGFCKASHSHSHGVEDITVECEIYEPEAAEKEKKLHLLGGETDHSHGSSHADGVDQTHDVAHDAAGTHTHDHVHDHTKSHGHHDKTLVHANNSDHHHTHDHAEGSGNRHDHDHSHDHGHSHDHVHAHHAVAHNHSDDSPNHHHNYQHAVAVHTHDHDHEHALDHDHKHAHLHEHEHHHHHHEHEHETSPHDHPEGTVRTLPAMDQPTTLPSFPDEPVADAKAGVILLLIPDPQIPGEREPTILPFPVAAASAECPGPVKEGGSNLVVTLLAEDPTFKAAA